MKDDGRSETYPTHETVEKVHLVGSDGRLSIQSCI